MIVLGIDPGKTGGLALIDGGSPRGARLIRAIDVPAPRGSSDDLLDVDAIIDFVQRGRPDVAYIERVSPMPSRDPGKKSGKRDSMGATSAFNFGGAVYTLRTCVRGLGVRLVRVETVHWKKAHGLSSRDPATGEKLIQRDVKELSRQRAIALFGPEHFPNIGHHNRAEAALIALFGLMCERGA